MIELPLWIALISATLLAFFAIYAIILDGKHKTAHELAAYWRTMYYQACTAHYDDLKKYKKNDYKYPAGYVKDGVKVGGKFCSAKDYYAATQKIKAKKPFHETV